MSDLYKGLNELVLKAKEEGVDPNELAFEVMEMESRLLRGEGIIDTGLLENGKIRDFNESGGDALKYYIYYLNHLEGYRHYWWAEQIKELTGEDPLQE